MQVLFIGSFTLQNQVERIREFASESEATAIMHILFGAEINIYRHRIASFCLGRRALVAMSQVQGVLHGQRVEGPAGLHCALRNNGFRSGNTKKEN